MRWFAALEVLLLCGLYYLSAWRLAYDYSPRSLLATGLIILYPIASNLIQKKSWSDLGIVRNDFKPSLKLTSIWTAISLIFIMGLYLKFGEHTPNTRPINGVALGSWSINIHSVPEMAGFYFLWALAQQYILMGFIFERGRRMFANEKGAAMLTFVLFVAAHWPNPVLVIASGLIGICFILTFLRHRNWLPLAMAHAILGTALFKAIEGSFSYFLVGRYYPYQ